MPEFDPTPRASRLFIATLYAGMAAMAGWFLFYAPWQSGDLRMYAAGMIIASVWPLTRWIRSQDESYPLVETLLMMTVPFYLMPLINEHRALSVYPEAVVAKATLCVLCFQVAVIFGSMIPHRRERRFGPGWTAPLLPDDRLQLLSLGLFVNTAWLFIATFTRIVPPSLVGSFRALFIGIGLISAFTVARLWALGYLKPGMRLWVAVNLLAQVSMIAVSLLLIQALVLLAVTLLGYFSAVRRAPWLVVAAALALFTVLHNGKSDMRRQFWDEGRPPPTVLQLPEFYTEWFEVGLEAMGRDQEQSAMLLFDRASLLQIVAYVVDRVPERQDYLGGATYGAIPAQVVPRFLWPDKPSPNDSVKMLSVGLGLLSARAAESTSIGFGMIAESYANFGLLGAAMVGLAIGWVMQYVSIITTGSSTFSVLGLLRILCLAWCLSAEVTLVVWLSSFYQACIAVFAPLLLWRHLSGGPAAEVRTIPDRD